MSKSKEIPRRRFLQFALATPGVLTSQNIDKLIELVGGRKDKKLEVKETELNLISELAGIIREEDNKRSQSTPDSIESRNTGVYQEAISDEEGIKYLEELRQRYSLNVDEISPVIKNTIPGHRIDYESIQEVLEARKIPNVHERVLTMIKLLSIQTKEDLIDKKRGSLVGDRLLKIMIHIDNINLLIANYEKLSTQSEIISRKIKFPELERLKIILEELIKIQDSLQSIYNQSETNPLFNDKESCNLYAGLLIGMLGLEHRFSHRVNENGKPVKSGGRELSAGNTLKWFLKHGERYGWKRVTHLSYAEKVQMLKEGYIFYGANTGHNWIVTGVEYMGSIRPALTQATEHTLLKFFKTANIIRSPYESYYGFLTNTREKALLTKEQYLYGANYKLMPFGNGTEEMFAIHIDDSKNPPIQ